MKHTISLVMMFLIMMMFTSCGLMSDSETEKKIEGQWTSFEYETEDGMRMKMQETVTYHVSKGSGDNTFESKIRMDIVSPMKIYLGEVSYSGTWSATKKKLIGEIDKKSVKIEFNSLVDSSDRREIKREMMKELEANDYIDGGLILSISDDEMRIEDEEDHEIYTYERVDSDERVDDKPQQMEVIESEEVADSDDEYYPDSWQEDEVSKSDVLMSVWRNSRDSGTGEEIAYYSGHFLYKDKAWPIKIKFVLLPQDMWAEYTNVSQNFEMTLGMTDKEYGLLLESDDEKPLTIRLTDVDGDEISGKATWNGTTTTVRIRPTK